MTPGVRNTLVLIVLLTSGCASRHGLQPTAQLRAPDTLTASQTLAPASAAADVWPNEDWWTTLGDAQLDELIREALRDSPALQIAAARARAELAEAGIAEAAGAPQLIASGSATREHFSANGIYPPPFGGSTATLSELQVTLSWELDFWGRQREAYQNVLGLARASAMEQQAARLALSASIAHAYVQLQHAYLQLDVAAATLAQREQITALTRDRNAAALDSRLEVRQTEEALPATREQLIQWLI
jgi:outer membrane protein TolC